MNIFHERVIWMQDVHITCSWREVRQRAEAYEQVFAKRDTVALIDWGCSYKQEEGYIVLEWEGEVDQEFLACLNADRGVLDYCVYDVPCTELTVIPSEI